MKSLKFVTAALSLIGVWLSTCSMAEAGGQDFCPRYPVYTDEPGGNKSMIFYWRIEPLQFGGKFQLLHFYKDRITLMGPGPFETITFDQLQKYEPILDDLRLAALHQRKVHIVWDDSTHQVQFVHVYWHVSC